MPNPIVRVKVFDDVNAGEELSVTVTTTLLKVPRDAGVPPNTPALLKLSPLGSPVAIHV